MNDESDDNISSATPDIVDDVDLFDETLVNTSMTNEWNLFNADMKDSNDLFFMLLDDEECIIDDDHEMTHDTTYEISEEIEATTPSIGSNFVTLVDKYYMQLVHIYDRRTEEEKKQRKNALNNIKNIM